MKEVYKMAKDVWGTRKSAKSVRLNARIKVGKNSVQIIPLEGDVGAKYVCRLENCPDNIVAGDWRIAMTEDGERIYSIAPIEGMYNLKFIGFAKGENEKIPTPQHAHFEGVDQETKKPYVTDYDYFTCLFEIIGAPGGDEDAVGMIMTKRLRYYFFNNNGVVGFDKPRSKYTGELKDWLADLGAYESGELEYSENILPDLEERLIKLRRKFIGTIKDGFLQSVVVSKAKGKVSKPDEVEVKVEDLEDDDFGAVFDEDEPNVKEANIDDFDEDFDEDWEE